MHDATGTCVLSYAFGPDTYCCINLWYLIIPENHVILICLIIHSLHHFQQRKQTRSSKTVISGHSSSCYLSIFVSLYIFGKVRKYLSKKHVKAPFYHVLGTKSLTVYYYSIATLTIYSLKGISSVEHLCGASASCIIVCLARK